MTDILKSITEQLPKVISDAVFEGANIVLYTDDKDFFKTGGSKIKGIVDQIKKRVELRADQKILASESDTEKTIREIYCSHRSQKTRDGDRQAGLNPGRHKECDDVDTGRSKITGNSLKDN
jgi:predicted metal-dependent RNase